MKNSYLQYAKYSILSMFLGVIVWTGLSVYMLLAKASIGEDNISIFEFIISVAGVTSVYIIYLRKYKYKNAVIMNILAESIFLLFFLYYAYNTNMYMAGIAVYCIIIVNYFIGGIEDETARVFEDEELRNKHYKRILRNIRKIRKLANQVGFLIGSGISMVCLNIFSVDINEFTQVIIILNVFQNIYDYFIWNKFLNK